MISEKEQTRFSANVNTDAENGCWEWLGTKNDVGYGLFRTRGESFYAHRVSYESYFGPIPNEAIIMHSCNNSLCVNPTHLRAGNKKANAIHTSMSGNTRHAKLKPEDVKEIRILCKQSGRSYRDIAKQFGVTHGAVSFIDKGKSYIWVED
jgi:hypothetical protein